MRLAGHRVVADATETQPVLLLDDVFSELDPERSEALLSALPGGQAILTSAEALPRLAQPELVVRIEDGKLLT
jgi:DNA replication and repair protein RecF